jgi:hypothetical protein
MRSTLLHIPLVIFKKVTRVLAACALTACMGVANASSTYDFYWCDLASGNEVFGYITGLQDIEGLQAATSVVTLSNDVIINEIDYLDLENDPAFSIYANRFEVIDGVIQYVQFYAESVDVSRTHYQEIYFNVFAGGSSTAGLSHWNRGTGERTTSGGVLQLARRIETVAEPGSVILLSLGLVGLAFSRYRKQS